MPITWTLSEATAEVDAEYNCVEFPQISVQVLDAETYADTADEYCPTMFDGVSMYQLAGNYSLEAAKAAAITAWVVDGAIVE
jgi:hypothetical protein